MIKNPKWVIEQVKQNSKSEFDRYVKFLYKDCYIVIVFDKRNKGDNNYYTYLFSSATGAIKDLYMFWFNNFSKEKEFSSLEECKNYVDNFVNLFLKLNLFS